MTLKISQLTPVAAGSLDGTEPVELGIAGDKNAPNGAFLPPGYIDGLKMQWVSATALTVTSGAAYVPSLGRVIRANAAIATAGLVLAASTWYHVYLYLNGTTPAIEVVTAAPSAPYNGTACTKTGDTSRRYVGSVLTDASSNIIPFIQNANRISYIPAAGTVGMTPFRILSAGTATAATVVAGSGIIPATSKLGQLRVQNNGTGAGYVGPGIPISNPQSSGPGTASPPGLPWFIDAPTGTDQSYIYYVASGGQMYLDVVGYVYER